jgi:hypothetical protein
MARAAKSPMAALDFFLLLGAAVFIISSIGLGAD